MKQTDMSCEREWKSICAAMRANKTMCTLSLTERYLAQYPRDGRAWCVLGHTLYGIARYDKAVRALRKALRYMPNEAVYLAHYRMAMMYRRKGQYRAAERWFHKGIASAPKQTANLIGLGAILARQGRTTEAKRYHRRAANLGDEEGYLNLGLILRAEGKYEAALEAFDKAIQIDSDYELAKRERRDVAEAMKIGTRG